MNIRKTYLSVKIPSSMPENVENSINQDIILNQECPKIVKNTISLSHKLSAMVPKYYQPTFPFILNFPASDSVQKCKFYLRESITPLRYGKCVRSVLDSKSVLSERAYVKQYSSFIASKVKLRGSNSRKIREKLIPLSKKPSKNIDFQKNL
jgi:hypothetical protein